MKRWLSFGPRTEHPGALRVDILPLADMIGDIRCLPFEVETFDGVECLAVLEHIGRDEAPGALRELWRVLKAGGELDLATQDMDACARTLLKGNLEVLLNIYSPHAEPAFRHQWGYTWPMLEQVVREAGFVNLSQIAENDPHAMRIQAWKPQ